MKTLTMIAAVTILAASSAANAWNNNGFGKTTVTVTVQVTVMVLVTVLVTVLAILTATSIQASLSV